MSKRKLIPRTNSTVPARSTSLACGCGKGFLFLFAVLSILIPTGHSPTAFGESDPSMEYRVKAAFIYNFAKFVTWPAEVFENDKTPFTIGVLGKDPFGNIMEQTVAGKTLKGRDIAVKRFGGIEEIKPCHILFVSSSEQARLSEFSAALEEAPVLTVGEMQGFLHKGGVVNFVVMEKNVRFEINLDNADSSGLKISSKLLSLAKVIQSGE